MPVPNQIEGVLLTPRVSIRGSYVAMPTKGKSVVHHVFDSGLILTIFSSGLLQFNFQGMVSAGKGYPNYSQEESRRKLINSVLLIIRSRVTGIALVCSIDWEDLIFFPNMGSLSGYSTKNEYFRSLENSSQKSAAIYSKKLFQRYPTLRLAQVKSALAHANTHLSGVKESVLDELEILSKALRAYDQGDYSTSFSHSWIVIEHETSKLWEQFLTKQITVPNGWFWGARKDLYLSIAMTVSMKMEILSQTKEVRFEDYRSVFKLRKKRNEWFHSMSRVDKLIAKESILHAGKMILKRSKLLVVPKLA